MSICTVGGVFPEPDYTIYDNHSYYTLESQQKCIEIRKTGIGLNGKAVIFNKPRTKSNKTKKALCKTNNRYEELTAILRQWRWNVSCIDVKTAVKIKYPKGLKESHDDGKILRDVIDYFKEKMLENSNKTV